MIQARSAAFIGGFAVLYAIAAWAGLMLALIHASATSVWPPTGIAIAALLLFGRRMWPGVFIGAFIANVTTIRGGDAGGRRRRLAAHRGRQHARSRGG